jgi:hypothetical protein
VRREGCVRLRGRYTAPDIVLGISHDSPPSSLVGVDELVTFGDCYAR